MRVGVVGLGSIGRPVAHNLLRAGHDVAVHSRSLGPEDELVALGAAAPGSAAGVAEISEVLLLSLPDGPAVRQVVEEAADSLRPGCVVVDTSTIDIATSRYAAATCGRQRASYLDAPVSGGTAGATSGRLTVMVGGDRAAFDVALPVLRDIGEKIVHVGDLGAGMTVKLVNQILVGIGISAAAEAFALAERVGIDPDVLFDLLGSSSAASWALERARPRLISKDFSPAFRLGLLVKDLRLARDLADERRAPLPLTDAALRQYETAAAAGLADRDVTSVVAVLTTESADPDVVNGVADAVGSGARQGPNHGSTGPQ